MGKQKALISDSSLNGERCPPLFESLHARQCVVTECQTGLGPAKRKKSVPGRTITQTARQATTTSWRNGVS